MTHEIKNHNQTKQIPIVKFKSYFTGVFFVALLCGGLFTLAPSAFALDIPAITATAWGPNHIILTWSALANPGRGYQVEIQSDNDSRYSSWTKYTWQNGLDYLPYWVTDQGGTQKPYTDPTTAASGWGQNAQANLYGLKYGTLYNFRVRTWSKNDSAAAVYGSYSATASATTTTPAVIRYVTPTGAGSKNGTSWANAWDDISDANGVAAGTLVLIGGESYASDHLAPTNSGTFGTGRTVYQANYGETPTITSQNGPINVAIHLTRNFIVLDGLHLAGTATIGTEPPVTIEGDRNVIANCDFQSLKTGNQFSIVWMYPSPQYNLIHNSYIHEVSGTQQEGEPVSMLGVGVDYNTVQYCHLADGAHGQGIVKDGPQYNRWLNNLADGGEGMGFETVTYVGGTYYNLMEGYIVKNTGTQNGYTAYKPGIEISSGRNTIRRNIVYDGKSTNPLGSNSAGIEVSAFNLGDADNNLIYNNTFVHNGNSGVTLWEARSNVVKNNIIYDNGVGPTEYCSNLHIQLSTGSGNANDISKNLILDVTAGGVENPGLPLISKSYSECVTVSAADAGYSDFASNYDNYSPNFINYASRDLYLKSTSEVLDLGESVTDSVWGTIPYNGSAPDLGAFEYYPASGGGGDTTPPASPTGLSVI